MTLHRHVTSVFQAFLNNRPEGICTNLIRFDLEINSCGELESSRAAAAENGVDSPCGLTEVESRIAARRCDRHSSVSRSGRCGPDVGIQRSAVTSQVRDVENVEAFSD